MEKLCISMVTTILVSKGDRNVYNSNSSAHGDYGRSDH